MAEEAKKPEKKPSRAERMYSKPLRIKDAEAREEKSEPASERKAEAEEGPSGESKESIGAPHVPLHEVHVREMKAMHTRHNSEYRDMVRRHAKELGKTDEEAA